MSAPRPWGDLFRFVWRPCSLDAATLLLSLERSASSCFWSFCAVTDRRRASKLCSYLSQAQRHHNRRHAQSLSYRPAMESIGTIICNNTTAAAGTTYSSPQHQPLPYHNQVYAKLQRSSTSRFNMHRIRRPHPQCDYDAGRTATHDDDPLEPAPHRTRAVGAIADMGQGLDFTLPCLLEILLSCLRCPLLVSKT